MMMIPTRLQARFEGSSFSVMALIPLRGMHSSCSGLAQPI
jgi:hypothetical protein